MSVKYSNSKIMKHIAILFSAVLAFLAVAVAAQEKESSKPKGSSQAAAAVEHKIVSPAELKWGRSTRIAARRKDGGVRRRSDQERFFYRSLASAGRLQDPATYPSNNRAN